ncbi:MAG TPA: DUF4388 domain-containing protein [Thermoanaerobaculia bacterium]|jgi:hypothetical protein|nr:DUF4388 domain-containing protein [Thermoanaerobaculia bacterium]
MSVEGNLDLFQLPEILQLVAQQQKTGILTVQGNEDIVAISFLHGKIVAADSLNQAVEEGLKQVLVETGVLSGAEFARASAEQAATGQRLVDFLVESRFVSRTRLLEALRIHTRQLLEKLLDWREGDFKFYSGEEVAYEEGFVPIRVDELLLHAGGAKPSAPAPPVRRAPIAVEANAPTSDAARPSAGALLGFPGSPASVSPAASAAARSSERLSEALPAIVLPFPGLEPPGPAKPGVTGTGLRQMTLEPAPVPRPIRHVGRVLGALAGCGLLALLIYRPDQAVFPFSWQSASLQALEETQRSAQFLKIDRAAQTFFLLEGRFPEHLSELRDRDLLGPHDLFDVEGRPLLLIPRETTYELHAEGRAGAEDATSRSISGNFLLDPEFLSLRPGTQAAPLVLLD